jgi:hypothetical protein
VKTTGSGFHEGPWVVSSVWCSMIWRPQTSQAHGSAPGMARRNSDKAATASETPISNKAGDAKGRAIHNPVEARVSDAAWRVLMISVWLRLPDLRTRR